MITSVAGMARLFYRPDKGLHHPAIVLQILTVLTGMGPVKAPIQ